jgi:hypothetical protein
MVRIGFIVEGYSEKILIESDTFRKWCEKNEIAIVAPVINAKGGGNLLPQYLSNYIINISENGRPDKIVVLTDLENICAVEKVRQRILTEEFKDKIDFVFVSIKALEAWFLADGIAMASWLGEKTFHEDHPEETPGMPHERIKQIAKDKNKRGPGPHPEFVKKMMRHGFSVERAATHPHCFSAKEFHDTLKEWGRSHS